MARVRLVLFPQEMDRMLQQPGGMVGRHMRTVGKKMQAGARAQVGKRTGRLALSIQVAQSRSAGGQEMTVGSSLPYALLVHRGSRPHFIVGRAGGALRFTSRGRVVYSRAVVHPGTKPNKYLSSQLYMVMS